MRKSILAYCSGLSFLIGELIIDKAPEEDLAAMSAVLTVLIEIASAEQQIGTGSKELTADDILNIIQNAGVMIDIDRVISLYERDYADEDILPSDFIDFLKSQKEQLGI